MYVFPISKKLFREIFRAKAYFGEKGEQWWWVAQEGEKEPWKVDEIRCCGHIHDNDVDLMIKNLFVFVMILIVNTYKLD